MAKDKKVNMIHDRRFGLHVDLGATFAHMRNGRECDLLAYGG